MKIFRWARGLLGGGATREGGASQRIDQVAPWLFIGPRLQVPEYVSLRDRGITHVIDLRAEDSDSREAMDTLGLRWAQFPITDRDAPAPGQFEELVAWLDADADPNTDQALYLHCQAGQGRTPTIAIALLMQHDIPLPEAHRMVRAARPESQPTARQMAWLEQMEQRRARGG